MNIKFTTLQTLVFLLIVYVFNTLNNQIYAQSYIYSTNTGSYSGSGTNVVNGSGTWSSPTVLPNYSIQITTSNNRITNYTTTLGGATVEVNSNNNAWENKYGPIDANNTSTIKVRSASNNSWTGQPIQASIVTTINFSSVAPANLWGFLLLDIDVDQVRIRAKDASGNYYSAAIVNSWFKGALDLSNDIDNSTPCWQSSTSTLVGVTYGCTRQTVLSANPETNGGAGYFEPNVPVSSLEFHFDNLQITATPSQRYFLAAARTFNISGNVFNDPNQGFVNNSTGTTNQIPSGYYASLIGSDNRVVAVTPVSTNGTYNFSNVRPDTYTVVLSTVQGIVGQAPPMVSNISGWVNTGEFNGLPNTGNTSPTDGRSASFVVSSANVTNINFGIRCTSTGTISNWVGCTDLGYISLSGLVTNYSAGGTWVRNIGTGGNFNAAAGTYLPTLTTSTTQQFYYITHNAPCTPDTSIVNINFAHPVDAGSDGHIKICHSNNSNISLFSLLSGAQTGGTWTRISGTGGTFNAAAGTFTTTNTTTTSTFRYVVTGTYPCANDTSYVTIEIEFCANLSGKVFNDLNGSTDNDVNGIDPVLNTTLYVHLLDSTGKIIAITTINASGEYNFENVKNGNYSVQINTIQGVINSTPPTQTLPDAWENTGDEIGSLQGTGKDGLSSIITVNNSHINNINFGIAPIPVAHDKSYTGLDENILKFNPTYNETYPNSIQLNNISASVINNYHTNDGSMPGNVTGTDYNAGNIGASAGTNPNMTFVTSGIVYNPETEEILEQSKLVYNNHGVNIILEPNPSPSSPAYPFWNSSTQTFEIPGFDPNQLNIWFEIEGQTGFKFNYAWKNGADILSNEATYIVNANNTLSILPVELLYFVGSVNHCKIELEWATASELNNKEFIIENSLNAKDWFVNGSVSGNGISNTTIQYNFTSTQQKNGIVYFRITQIDFDGTETQYPIISLTTNSCNENNIQVYPNPTRDILNIRLSDHSEIQRGIIHIYNLEGRLVMSENVSSTLIQINTNQLSAGKYILQYQNSGVQENIQFMVVR